MIKFVIAAAATAILPLPAAMAGAAPEDQSFQKQIFGHVLDVGPAHACFKRTYDAAHLARHPQQNVRTMTLLVTGKAEDPGQPSYRLGLGVTFRRSGSHFETEGDCGSIHGAAGSGKANVVNCGVDCDGGSIEVTLKNADTVLVAIPDGARIWKAGSGDDADAASDRKRFGADDTLFRLDHTDLKDCLPLATDDDKSAMKRGL